MLDPRAETNTPLFSGGGGNGGRRGGAGVQYHDVRLHTVEGNRLGGPVRDGFGEGPSGQMIIRQAFDMMVKGMDGCCGKHSRLPPATTEPLAQNPSSSDVVCGADQH